VKNYAKEDGMISKLVATLTLIGLVYLTGIAHAGTIYVPDDYVSIQDAVNSSNSGDSIVVRDGIYIENLIIDKAVKIVSENGNSSTVIKPRNPREHVISINSNNVTINGFTIIGSNICNYAGVKLDQVKNCIIINNLIKNNCWGIAIFGTSSNNTIENNTLTGNGRGIIGGGKFNVLKSNYVYDNIGGINFGGQHNYILHNNISENIIGIFLTGYYDVVEFNTITLNYYEGIYLAWGSYNKITKNNVNKNGVGIRILESNHNWIFLNNFICNTKTYSFEGALGWVPSDNFWNSSQPLNYEYKGISYVNYMGNYWGGARDFDGDGLAMNRSCFIHLMQITTLSSNLGNITLDTNKLERFQFQRLQY